jgi:peptidoglycan/xylan/chitin deacetylase (PgdA/CDA1 family)
LNQFILNFHGIGLPHAGVDAAERPYWISEDFFASIIDAVLARGDADRIFWTFDDGNRSDLTIGARLLAKHGLTGRFFLLTGRFNDPRYLSPEDAVTLTGMGMMLGLHGRDHIDWRKAPPEQLYAETVVAREALAIATGKTISDVAIPFGAYNRRVIAHLKRSGFAHIYTSDGGPSRSNQRVKSRTSVRSDMTMERLMCLIDDRLPLSKRLRRSASTTVRRHLL